MSRTITAARVATLVGPLGSDERPLYVELAEQLRLLIGEGRIPAATRLPSERELTTALGVSRTTVTRAYAELRERDYAESRRGSGPSPGCRCAPSRSPTGSSPRGRRTPTSSTSTAPRPAPRPASRRRTTRRCASCRRTSPATATTPPGSPASRPPSRRRTTSAACPRLPEQVIITAGALGAAAIVAQALTAPGDRVVVEDPVYPNATQALSHRSARLVPAPVDPGGWDIPATAAIIRQAAPGSPT